jgi:hypothetical protein
MNLLVNGKTVKVTAADDTGKQIRQLPIRDQLTKV